MNSMRQPGMIRGVTAAGMLISALMAVAADSSSLDVPKELSLEELINIKVTSVSKRETPLDDSPAAIAVLTGDDIERLGFTSVAEALRAVPGMNVARMNANVWAITARGFNNQYANKLLVLVDGRTVYTPTFGGVYWDLQDFVMEDLDRVEVIRGPGASLWGANAVNGVINITSKSAKDTQGVLVSGIYGTELQPEISARYGGQLSSNVFFRVYGKYSRQDNFQDAHGHTMEDESEIGRGGFRLDWEPSPQNLLTFSGDYYENTFGEQVFKTAAAPPTNAFFDVDVPGRGGNVLGRWTHTTEGGSELKVQAFYDAYEHRNPFGGGAVVAGPDFGNTLALTETRHTGDIDLQHRFQLGSRQTITWGGGFRYTTDDLRSNGSEVLASPESKRDRLFSAFVQDEITLLPDRLQLTLGSKFEHNDFTGFEVEPSGRLLWTPNDRQTFWGAIGRAVRTPTRVERDLRANLLSFPLPDGTPAQVALLGNPDLQSERVISYELGYRIEPARRLSFDMAAFYCDYDLIASSQSTNQIEFTPPPPHVLLAPYQYHNGVPAQTYGAEVLAHWFPTDWWRLTASYSWLHTHGEQSTGALGSPQQQFNISSSIELGHGLEFDAAVYYVDRIFTTVGLSPQPTRVPDYLRVDVGLTWRVNSHLEIAVRGQNLLDPGHPEFTSFKTTNVAEIPRSVYGKLTWRF